MTSLMVQKAARSDLTVHAFWRRAEHCQFFLFLIQEVQQISPKTIKVCISETVITDIFKTLTFCNIK